jgi:hypothetical protein
MGNSLITPAIVIRPILLVFDSVNHKAPSGPATSAPRETLILGTGYSESTPLVVIRPI